VSGPNTQLVGRQRFLHGHEGRGGGESELTSFDRPLGYNLFEAAAAWNQRYNRYWTSLGVAGSWQHYDTPTVNGVPVDQRYRDGNVGVLSARFGYVVAPLTSVFIEVSGNRRNFDVDNFASTGYRVAGGLLFIALCLLGAIFFLQTPAIAAGIAGGASAGLADFANAASLSGGPRAGAPQGPQEASRSAPRGGGSIRPAGGRA